MPINKDIVRKYPIYFDAKYDPARVQGQWVDIYDTRSRFISGQFTASSDIEAGTFVMVDDDATDKVQKYGYTYVCNITKEKVDLYGSRNTLVRPIGVALINPTRGLKSTYYNKEKNVWMYKKDTIITIATEGDIYMYAEGRVRSHESVFTRFAADGKKDRLGALASANPAPGSAPPPGLMMVSPQTFRFLESTTEEGGIVAVRLL